MAEIFSGLITSWTNTILLVIVAVLAVLVFFGIGYLIARIINMVAKHFLEKIKLEEFIAEYGLSKALLGFTVTQIVTVYIKLYVVLASLGFGIALAESLAGMKIPFLTEVVLAPFISYLGVLAQGIVVIVAALFIATYLANTIRGSKMLMGRQLAVAIQILIAYVALILALPSVLPNIDTTVFLKILEYFMLALIFAFGLGTGLAFGLGLKDSISKAANKNQKIFDDMIERIGRR